MGRVNDCIVELQKKKGYANSPAEKRFKARIMKLRKGFGELDYWEEGVAVTDALKDTERRIANVKRQAVLMSHRFAEAKKYRAPNTVLTRNVLRLNDAVEAVRAMLTRDPWGKAAYPNVSDNGAAYRRLFYSKWGAEYLSKARTHWVGLTQDREHLFNVVRGLFGEDVSDAVAAGSAKAYGETREFGRKLFNRFGGDIRFRKDHGAPMIHKAAKILKATKDDWVEFSLPHMNPYRMFDAVGQPIADRQNLLKRTLEAVYDGFATRGEGGIIEDFAYPATANTRLDPRVMQFRNADSWIAYNERFGEPDIFRTLTSHLDGMARDIGMMEVLGPNPEAGVRSLKKLAEKNGASQRQLKIIDREWAVVSGKVNQNGGVTRFDAEANTEDAPTWLDRVWRRQSYGGAGRGMRHLLMGSQLGRAVFSTVTDQNTMRITAHFNGMPAMRMYSEVLAQLSSEDRRQFGVILGMGAENWMDRNIGLQRFAEDVGASDRLSQMSNFVIRSSGLNAITDANRKAFAIVYSHTLAKNVKRTLGELDDSLRSRMESSGITPEIWDIIRSSELVTRDGESFVSMQNVLENKQLDVSEAVRLEASQRLSSMIIRESEFAVPTSDLRARAMMLRESKVNTLEGEFARMIGLYKQFPFTLLYTHYARALTMPGKWSRAKYLSNLFIGNTILGALAIQAKDLAKGKDPRPMNTWKFWLAAMAQGGAVGILGDFAFSNVNRFGGGLIKTVAGPGAQLVDDAYGVVQLMLNGDFEKIPADILRFAGKYTPGQSLWYGGLAMRRLIFDQLEQLADPKRYNQYRAREKRMRTQYGQEFWWRPGRATPSRLPKPENVAR